MTIENDGLHRFAHSLVRVSDFKRQPTKYLKAIGPEQSLNITVHGKVTYVVQRAEDALEATARYFAVLKRAGELSPELAGMLERDGERLFGAGWEIR